jgi:hypothetical protein
MKRELIDCQCGQAAPEKHKKCGWCFAHLPDGAKECRAADCERVGAEFHGETYKAKCTTCDDSGYYMGIRCIDCADPYSLD